MIRIRLPYHRTFMEADIPARKLTAVLRPASHEGSGGRSPSLVDQQLCVNQALDRPIHSPLLETLVVGKKTVTVIVSDHTRPVPSHITLPLLLGRMRRGNPAIAATILVATGCHRVPADPELRDKFGDRICDSERVVIHDGVGGSWNSGSSGTR